MAIEMIERRGVRLTFIPKGTRPYSRGTLRSDPDFFGDTLLISERRDIDKEALLDLASKYERPIDEIERALIRMLYTTRIHRRIINLGIREALLR